MAHMLETKDFGAAGFKWLTLKRITYIDQTGKTRFWESAERRARHGPVDGVAVIAKVRSAHSAPKLILESQYRPPQDSYVLEFPAGLVDENESAADAALRELKEETGYSGAVVEVSPVLYSDPGMSNANMQYVVVDVDADAAENCAVVPQLEEGEFIEVVLQPLEQLHASLLALRAEKGWDVDARLLLYAAGLEHAKTWSLHSSPVGASGNHQLASNSSFHQADEREVSTGSADVLEKAAPQSNGGSGSATDNNTTMANATTSAMVCFGTGLAAGLVAAGLIGWLRDRQ